MWKPFRIPTVVALKHAQQIKQELGAWAGWWANQPEAEPVTDEDMAAAVELMMQALELIVLLETKAPKLARRAKHHN